MTDPTNLLHDLYRAAREIEADAFQEHALRLIKPVLTFAEAGWGEGRLATPGVSPRHVHLHSADPERLVAWKGVNRVDKAIPIAVPRRGETIQFHAPTLFCEPDDKEMREYTTKFGHQCYLITVFETRDPEDVEWISLYRPNPDNHFTAAETDLCQTVMPHFAQALQINRICNGARVLARQDEEILYSAVANSLGTILFAQSGFLSLVRKEWKEAGPTILPDRLIRSLGESPTGTYIGNHVVFKSRTSSKLTLIRARPVSPLDLLSPRRSQIAWMVANGLSQKSIALKLRISPITVRNQLSAVYRDLGISNKAALVRLARTFNAADVDSL